MRTREMKANIKRGIELLDKYGPDNWRDKVELDRLDLNDCEVCILGQVYSHYWQGVEELERILDTELLIRDRAQYGFTLDTCGSDDIRDSAFDHLTQLWKEALS